MSHQIVLSILNLLNAKQQMSEEEYEYACYYLEVLCIDFFKLLQVYAISYFSNVFAETLLMSFSYQMIRKHAGGWHALSSLNCSLISVFSFVGIPLSINALKLYQIDELSWLIALIAVICIYRYAPADTEKNPLVSVSERKCRREKALFFIILFIIIAFIQPDKQIRLLLLVGLFIESIVITPFIYKLTKRSYKNYEYYQEEC